MRAIDEGSSTNSLPSQNLVTFIMFRVSVPVLSVQIIVTDAMVSQTESFLTITLSPIMCFIEQASMSVTAKSKTFRNCHIISVKLPQQ